MSAPPRRLWLVPVVVGLAVAGAWLSAHRRGATAAEAVALGDGRPKLLELGMGVCKQCQAMKPVMEQASRELRGRVDVHVLDIRVEPNGQLAERYQMRTMPLIILADGAGKELWRHEGFVDFPELSNAVDQRLGAR